MNENYFIDERTGTKIYATLDNTVIHATHRNCDLIPSFLDVIRDTAEYAQLMSCGNSDIVRLVSDPTADERDPRWESEETEWFLQEELWDILDAYAPDGYYFGAHPGDGSDFGYWRDEEFID